MLFPKKLFTVVGATFVLVATPTLLSGCEFGNKSSTSLTGYDTISGYYMTLPQSISFEAQVGSGALRSKNGLVSEMPTLMKTIMANPTLLVFDDPIAGIGSIRSREYTSVGFFTLIDANAGTLGASEDISATVNGCRFVKSVTTSGKFSQLMSQQSISGVLARGKLSLHYDVTFETQGEDEDCASMRAQFESCFVDDVGCSSDPQNVYYTGRIHEMFAPFVNAGLMTAEEISSTKSVRYRAAYDN